MPDGKFFHHDFWFFCTFFPISWLTRSNFLTNVDCWVLLQKKFFFREHSSSIKWKRLLKKVERVGRYIFFFILSKKHQTHHIKKCFCDQALLQTLKYVVYHVLQTIKCILYYMAKNGQILSWWYGFFKLSNIYKSLDKL